ncbi:MAG: hypothetical protein IJK19_04600 [Bacteroidales bacterium]|nr:hypothetical protein [Bacteroidales bacterium]
MATLKDKLTQYGVILCHCREEYGMNSSDINNAIQEPMWFANKWCAAVRNDAYAAWVRLHLGGMTRLNLIQQGYVWAGFYGEVKANYNRPKDTKPVEKIMCTISLNVSPEIYDISYRLTDAGYVLDELVSDMIMEIARDADGILTEHEIEAYDAGVRFWRRC